MKRGTLLGLGIASAIGAGMFMERDAIHDGILLRVSPQAFVEKWKGKRREMFGQLYRECEAATGTGAPKFDCLKEAMQRVYVRYGDWHAPL